MAKRAKSPLQTVYLDKDLIKHKLPSLTTNNDNKEEDNKKTRKFVMIKINHSILGL